MRAVIPFTDDNSSWNPCYVTIRAGAALFRFTDDPNVLERRKAPLASQIEARSPHRRSDYYAVGISDGETPYPGRELMAVHESDVISTRPFCPPVTGGEQLKAAEKKGRMDVKSEVVIATAAIPDDPP